MQRTSSHGDGCGGGVCEEWEMGLLGVGVWLKCGSGVLWWWLTDGGRRRTWGRRRRLFKFWRCGLRECKAAGKSNHRSLGQVPALADFPQHTRSGSSGPRRAPERQGCGHLQRAAKHGPTPLVRPCFSHQPGDANYHWVKRMSKSSALESGRLGRIFLTGSTASTSARDSASARGTGGRQHGFTFTSQRDGIRLPFASQVETCELNIGRR